MVLSPILGAAEDAAGSAHYGFNFEPPGSVPCHSRKPSYSSCMGVGAKPGSLRSLPQDISEDYDQSDLFDDICSQIMSDLGINPGIQQGIVDMSDWGHDGRVRQALLLKLDQICEKLWLLINPKPQNPSKPQTMDFMLLHGTKGPRPLHSPCERTARRFEFVLRQQAGCRQPDVEGS